MSAPYALLLDNDRRYALDLETILGGAGIHLKVAESPAQAKLLVRREKPQLLLLDLDRPPSETTRLLRDLSALEVRAPHAWVGTMITADMVRRVQSSGALGLMDRFADTVSTLCAVRALLAGDRYFPPLHTDPATPTAKAEAESRRIIKLLQIHCDQSEG